MLNVIKHLNKSNILQGMLGLVQILHQVVIVIHLQIDQKNTIFLFII